MSVFPVFFKIMRIVLKDKKDKWNVFVVTVIRVALFAINLIPALLIAHVVDTLIPTEDISGLWTWILLVIIFTIAALLYLAIFASYLPEKFKRYAAARLQTNMTHKLFNIKNYNYKKHSDGKLINVLSNDYADGTDMVYMFITSGLISFVSLVLILIILFNISIAVGIVAIVSLPLYVWIMFANNNRVQNYRKLGYEEVDKRQSIRKYIVERMKQVNAAGMGDIYEDYNTETVFQHTKAHLKWWYWYMLSMFSPNIIPQSIKYIAIFIGAIGVINGDMTLGILLLLSAYAEQVTQPMRDISETVVRITSGKITFERLYEILKEEEEIDDYKNLVMYDNSLKPSQPSTQTPKY